MNQRPLNPNQLTAARLLLYGHSVSDIAQVLHLHRYTLSRWKKDPRFQAELRRQIDLAARHTAQHCATNLAPAQIKATTVPDERTTHGQPQPAPSTPPTPLLYSPITLLP